jgi:Arc/MetJ family transcription regulator
MRTTITVDDDLINDLREATGIAETSLIVRRALVEMRERTAAQRLAALGGSLPKLDLPPRSRAPQS